jgi:tetratricopeptide (TPR) repeat protein
MLTIVAMWALCLSPWLARLAWAETGNAEIDAAIAQYDDLEYQKAADALEKALVKPNLTKQELVEGYRVLGLSYVALGKDEPARTAFKKLLAADPTFQLARTENPHALDLFDEVKAQLPVAPALQVTAAVSPTRPRAGGTIAITVALAGDASGVKQIVVHHRVQGAKEFSTVTAAHDGAGFSATIPGTFVAAPAIEYFVTAEGDDGVVLTAQGSVAAPLVVTVEAGGRHAKPVYARWWFWGGIGAVAAGSIAAFLLLGGSHSTSTDSTVTITVNQ